MPTISLDDPTRCPVNDIIGKWRERSIQARPPKEPGMKSDNASLLTNGDITQNWPSSRESTSSQVEGSDPHWKKNVLRIPELQGPRLTAEHVTLIQQSAQTTSWVAQMMLEKHTEVEEMVLKLETWQADTVDKIAAKVHLACSAIPELVHAQITEEFRAHHLWVSDQFQKLGQVLHRQPHEGMRMCDICPQILPTFHDVQPERQLDGETPDKDDLGSHTPPIATRDIHLEDEEEERTKAREPEAEDERKDKDLAAEGRWQASKPKASAIHGFTSAQKGKLKAEVSLYSPESGKRDAPRFGLKSEKGKLDAHANRMKVMLRKSSLFALCLKCCKFSDRTIHHFRRRPDNILSRTVDSTAFGGISLTVVLLNAAWIGYQTEDALNQLHVGISVSPRWHQQVNRAFASIFGIELLIRLVAFRMYFFFCKDWRWNLYDAFVVLGAVAEEVMSSMNTTFLRTFRVIRMVRVAKVIRVIRFFHQMRYLLCTMLASSSMLIWTFLFLCFLIYVFSIILLQGLIDSEITDTQLSKIEKYYGTLGVTMFSLLMAASGGLPWDTLVAPIRDVEPAMVAAFVLYVIIVLYGVLNVVTAVFVEQATTIKQHDRDLAIHKEMSDSDAFARELRSFWEDHGICDEDIIHWEDFERIMTRADVQLFLQTHCIDVTDAREMFLLLDEEGDGQIGITDFVFGCQRLKGTARGMDLVLLYDQVVDAKARITAINDKQAGMQHEVRRNADRVMTAMSHVILAMREMSADVYVQLHQRLKSPCRSGFDFDQVETSRRSGFDFDFDQAGTFRKSGFDFDQAGTSRRSGFDVDQAATSSSSKVLI